MKSRSKIRKLKENAQELKRNGQWEEGMFKSLFATFLVWNLLHIYGGR